MRRGRLARCGPDAGQMHRCASAGIGAQALRPASASRPGPRPGPDRKARPGGRPGARPGARSGEWWPRPDGQGTDPAGGSCGRILWAAGRALAVDGRLQDLLRPLPEVRRPDDGARARRHGVHAGVLGAHHVDVALREGGHAALGQLSLEGVERDLAVADLAADGLPDGFPDDRRDDRRRTAPRDRAPARPAAPSRSGRARAAPRRRPCRAWPSGAASGRDRPGQTSGPAGSARHPALPDRVDLLERVVHARQREAAHRGARRPQQVDHADRPGRARPRPASRCRARAWSPRRRGGCRGGASPRRRGGQNRPSRRRALRWRALGRRALRWRASRRGREGRARTPPPRPSSARPITAASPCDPATTSARSRISCGSLAGSRAITRRASPASSRCRTTCCPMLPVGVVTTIMGDSPRPRRARGRPGPRQAGDGAGQRAAHPRPTRSPLEAPFATRPRARLLPPARPGRPFCLRAFGRPVACAPQAPLFACAPCAPQAPLLLARLQAPFLLARLQAPRCLRAFRRDGAG